MARANNQVNKSSGNNNWMTRPEIYKPILDFIGRDKFDIDVCCSKPNIPANFYFYEEFDSLKLAWSNPWLSICWMNPPYGEALRKFIEKAAEESKGNCEVWSILPARTENKYYHDLIYNNPNTFTVLLQGKQGFINPENPEEKIKPSLVCQITYFGKNAEYWATEWIKHRPLKGTLMRIVEG